MECVLDQGCPIHIGENAVQLADEIPLRQSCRNCVILCESNAANLILPPFLDRCPNLRKQPVYYLDSSESRKQMESLLPLWDAWVRDGMDRQGETEAMLTMLADAVETLLAYDNAELQFFMADRDVISDLDNYADHIHVAGYATPFIYIYFLLMLNLDTKRNTLLLAGFLLGLVIDMFANTPGMNAAATTLLAFLRPWLLSLFVPRDNTDDRRPGVRSMGFGPFLGYVLTAVFVHHTVLLLLDTFSFFDWKTLVLKVLASTALTTFCVAVLDSTRKGKA